MDALLHEPGMKSKSWRLCFIPLAGLSVSVPIPLRLCNPLQVCVNYLHGVQSLKSWKPLRKSWNFSPFMEPKPWNI